MELFSLSHIGYLAISFGLITILYFLLRKKSQKTQSNFILTLLIISFIIHFLKLLLPEYKDYLPYSLSSITFESICAISTLTFPFIFVSKNKYLKDYMVTIGIVSGIITLLLPLETISNNFFNLENIRFFFAHFVILTSSLFMYLFKIHKLEGHFLKNSIIIFLIAILIMLVNNCIFIYFAYDKETLLEYLNSLYQ